MSELLRALMVSNARRRPIASLNDWWARHLEVRRGWSDPVDVAMIAGFGADRLGYAFGSGYQCAAEAMVGELAVERRCAFCATEAGGVHPRAIESRLDDGKLWGEKVFVTFGVEAELLLVVATEGLGDDGRNRLRLVALTPGEGVEVTALPPTPFVPEIPHARVRFEAAPVERVLPGDGYADYLKPFRTIEDIHVHAALLGWLVAVARRHGFADHHLEEMLAIASSLRQLARESSSDSALHLALAGTIQSTRRLVEALPWERVDDAERSLWERDRRLLDVASKARAARREAARKRL